MDERPSLKEELLEMLHRSAHLLHRSGPHLRRRGHRPPMPPAQDRLLRLLLTTGPLTQRDLAELLNVRSASLSELLGKLEKPGWIRRRPHETDKRTIDIDLTEEGEQMLRSIGNERAAMADEVFGNLTEEELRQLQGLLGKLIGDWETRFESDEPRSRPDRRGHGPGLFHRLHGRFHHHHGPDRGPHDHHHYQSEGAEAAPDEGRTRGRHSRRDHRAPGGPDQQAASSLNIESQGQAGPKT